MPVLLDREACNGHGAVQHLQPAGVTQLADGVGMLAEQAAEAFAWWRGVRPETGAIIRQLTVPLI